MRANVFLMINALIVGVLVWRILRTKARSPTPLRVEIKRFRYPFGSKGQDPYPAEKSLNCHFQYNGHTWDAFEVLGVPAGSNRQACARALHDMRRNQEAAKDFLDAAWSALEKRFS